jgi:hypothetical protein
MQSLKNPALQTATSGLTIEIRVGERMQRFEPRGRPCPQARGHWASARPSPGRRRAFSISTDDG